VAVVFGGILEAESMRSFSLAVLTSSVVSLGLAGAASASVVVSQSFASQPSDWTPVTNGSAAPGTISFANSNLDVSGFASPGNSDGAAENYTTTGSMTYSTSGTTRSGILSIAFDVKFNTTELAISNDPSDPTYNRGSDDNPLIAVAGGGNNPLANFGLNPYGYSGSYLYAPSLSAGIEFGGGNTIVSDGPNQIPAAEIDGQSYHVVLNIAITDGGPDASSPGNDLWTVADTLTMSNASNTFVFDTTKQADANYDPLDSQLEYAIGTVYLPGYQIGGFSDGTPQQGLTGDIAFSNFNATNPLPAPEPASLGLLGIGAALGLIRRRRA
jgi:hypothetical protein